MRLTTAERNQVDHAILLALSRSPRGTGPLGARRWMTAYQILTHLARPVRVLLQDRYGRSGRHAGTFFGAASAIAIFCRRLSRSSGRLIVIDYFDTRAIEIRIRGQSRPVPPSYSPCGIYRLR